jgi:microcystin-dependent protein
MADTGSGLGHNNRQPFLTLDFIIAFEGDFLTRS